MTRLLLVLLAATALLTTACQSANPGAQEFIPGKGWKPVR